MAANIPRTTSRYAGRALGALPGGHDASSVGAAVTSIATSVTQTEDCTGGHARLHMIGHALHRRRVKTGDAPISCVETLENYCNTKSNDLGPSATGQVGGCRVREIYGCVERRRQLATRLESKILGRSNGQRNVGQWMMCCQWAVTCMSYAPPRLSLMSSLLNTSYQADAAHLLASQALLSAVHR